MADVIYGGAAEPPPPTLTAARGEIPDPPQSRLDYLTEHLHANAERVAAIKDRLKNFIYAVVGPFESPPDKSTETETDIPEGSIDRLVIAVNNVDVQLDKLTLMMTNLEEMNL